MSLILPESLARTYAIRAPLRTHFRRAHCSEVGCDSYMRGWRIRKDALNAGQQYFIRTSGRSYRELVISQIETWYVFEPGQLCFQTHRVRLDKPELYFVGQGTPGHPGAAARQWLQEARQHVNPDDWTDDMQEVLGNLQERRNRG